MSKKDIIEVEDGREFTSRTIVGGRPLGARKTRLIIRAGIEKALYKAAIDPGFRRDLLADRMEAVRSRGIRLTEAEAGILSSVPADRLALMIDRIRPEKHGKRRFMKAVATAVVTLATGTVGVACEDKGSPDATSDAPVDSPIDGPIDILGDTSDVPDIPDDLEMEADTPPIEGIVPDIPPDAPEEDVGDEDAPEDEGDVG